MVDYSIGAVNGGFTDDSRKMGHMLTRRFSLYSLWTDRNFIGVSVNKRKVRDFFSYACSKNQRIKIECYR